MCNNEYETRGQIIFLHIMIQYIHLTSLWSTSIPKNKNWNSRIGLIFHFAVRCIGVAYPPLHSYRKCIVRYDESKHHIF
jgi:hypothetical protein